MANAEKRLLKAFLCHASGDKPPVHDLYKRLTAEGVDAWLDKERLLPGQDWRLEIPKAVREADVVVICLSKKSITKEGYVQKEIKFALDIAEEKPEGTIFLIPARLEDCIVPERLSRWHWVDLYEDDGFIKLLRSLKLRADAVGATVEPDLYVDSAKETDRRLEQLYTQGLAAFYTEDWDSACRCFQSILSERPNHKNASEKLEEAERQRSLSKLYEQATAAVRSEDWGIAIQILEELSNKSAEYKDAAQLLRDARKKKQLSDLYTEAKALHVGKQWEAVVKVFEQISSIDPNYPDADGLLPSVQKKVAELQRLAELNGHYSQALHEMDMGNWHEARRLLEVVHKSETGFLETEKLLKKIENEIVKEEEKRRQNDQINTLYEQAHGLLRSKKWRNALDKMGEIRKLDEHFPDTDGIAEKAQKELGREEQEAERQNKLAALYAEAVKFLKEEKYQEALDKLGEIKTIDSKYPDRQWVQRTAKKKLAGKANKGTLQPFLSRRVLVSVAGIVILGMVVFAIAFAVRNNAIANQTITIPTSVVETDAAVVSSPISSPTIVIPSPTISPTLILPTATIPIPTATIDADPSVYDNFDNPEYENAFNSGRWKIDVNDSNGEIFQNEGTLVFIQTSKDEMLTEGYQVMSARSIKGNIMVLETKFKLEKTSVKGYITIALEGDNSDLRIQLAHFATANPSAFCHYDGYILAKSGYVHDSFGTTSISFDRWYTMKVEIDPTKKIARCFLDGQNTGYHQFLDGEPYYFNDLHISMGLTDDNSVVGSFNSAIDFIRVEQTE